MIVPWRDSGFSQKWAALAEWNNVPSTGDWVSKNGLPAEPGLIQCTQTYKSCLRVVFVCVSVCVCVYYTGRRCHSTMCGQACSIQTTTWAAPWQRAVKLSSSPAFPQRSWEVSTLGELDATGVGGGVIGRVKCEVLAIYVSLQEQCGCVTLVLWGKVFPLFCRPFSEFHWFPITALRKWNQSQDSSVAGEKANRRRMRHW